MGRCAARYRICEEARRFNSDFRNFLWFLNYGRKKDGPLRILTNNFDKSVLRFARKPFLREPFYLLQPFYLRFQNFDGCNPLPPSVQTSTSEPRYRGRRFISARASDYLGNRMLSVVFAVAGVRVRKYLKSKSTGSIPAHRIHS